MRNNQQKGGRLTSFISVPSHLCVMYNVAVEGLFDILVTPKVVVNCKLVIAKLSTGNSDKNTEEIVHALNA